MRMFLELSFVSAEVNWGGGGEGKGDVFIRISRPLVCISICVLLGLQLNVIYRTFIKICRYILNISVIRQLKHFQL
jgi:hypothetical protein